MKSLSLLATGWQEGEVKMIRRGSMIEGTVKEQAISDRVKELEALQRRLNLE